MFVSLHLTAKHNYASITHGEKPSVLIMPGVSFVVIFLASQFLNFTDLLLHSGSILPLPCQPAHIPYDHQMTIIHKAY